MQKVIIYVDDDIDDIEILQDCFATNPEYSLEGLSQANQLFDKLSSTENVCLVVMDINMPVINGVELLKSLKVHPQYSKLAVVMLSTSKLHSEQKIINDYGVDIIIKPSTYHDLSILAGRLLDYC